MFFYFLFFLSFRVAGDGKCLFFYFFIFIFLKLWNSGWW